MNLLVRHPGPKPTESLKGYVLRISEVNGYPSPWNLYRIAGIQQNETRTTGMKVEKLGAVTGRSLSDLKWIAYSGTPSKQGSCRLLGHDLLPIDLDLRTPRLCPLCVMEKGIIEAHWDLAFMVGCPAHRCPSAWTCGRCRSRLRWFRSGLLVCSCGADLRTENLPTLSMNTTVLLGFIRRKVLRESIASDKDHGFPVDALAKIDLRSALQVIRLLGRYRMIADGAKETSDTVALVNRSANVLSEWPDNFFHLLDDLDRSQEPNRRRGVRSHFSGLYTSVFKRSSNQDVRFLGFVREAFLEYLTQRWTGGALHGNLFKRFSGKASKRYLSASEISARYGVQPRTAARFLNLHRASFRPRDGSLRVLIDSREARLRNTVPGKILRAREAARALGISVPLLQHLRTNGLFEVDHLFPSRPGYHERDVDAFREMILGLEPVRGGVESDPKRLVNLAKVLKNPHTSVELKAAVLRGLFTGELRVVGTGDESTSDCFIDREAYEAFVKATNEQLAGYASTRAAARELGCEPECISQLAREGRLKGVTSPTGLRITVESIKEFRRSWMSLAALARRHRTSSRALRRRCEVTGIPLLLIPSRPQTAPQPFIHVGEITRLLADASGRANTDSLTLQPNNLLPIGDDNA